MRVRTGVAILFTLPFLWLVPVACRAQSSPSTDSTVSARADALLRQMTVEEKAGQLTNDPALEAEGQDEKVGGKIQKKIGQVEKVLEK